MGNPIRHVAITGASSGIGAALARAHAASGVRLSLCGRDEHRLTRVAEDCKRSGAEVDIALFDLADAQAAQDWVERTDRAQPIDLFYACAGLGGTSALSLPCGEDPEMVRQLLAVNATAALVTANAAARCFSLRNSGRIVLIGSLAGRTGLPHCPTYSATKAAVAVYADGLRRLMRPRGVTVTLVEPGYVETPMSRDVPGKVLVWPVDKAARRISRAALRGQAVLRFPILLCVALRLLSLLPRQIADLLLMAAHRGGK